MAGNEETMKETIAKLICIAAMVLYIIALNIDARAARYQLRRFVDEHK
jgi:hypothetical protein